MNYNIYNKNVNENKMTNRNLWYAYNNIYIKKNK